MVVYSPTEFTKGFAMIFPKAFMQSWNEEEVAIDKKWDNAGIKNSKILPLGGLPLKIKHRIADSKEIKTLWNLKLSMGACEKGK